MNLRVFYLTRRGISDGYKKRCTKTKPRNKKPKQKFETNKALQRTKKAPRPTSRGAFYIERLHCFPVSVAGRQECGD